MKVESYKEFLERIQSFEKPYTYYGEGYIHMNPNLAGKVNWDNQFRPFFGDTVVFDLNDTVKKEIGRVVDELYKDVPECFAERLNPATFHMTLHDLSNSPVLQDITEEMFWNELLMIKKQHRMEKNMCIRMKTNYIFNMVSNSLVLGLYPVDEEEYKKLMGLYDVVNEVKELNYPLTPHITLAYYNVHGFSEESARSLEKRIEEFNQDIHGMDIELNTNELYYQKFLHMNQYINIIKLG